jgi:hypothetical protein
MNCIAKPHYLPIIVLICCAACGVPATESLSAGNPLAYAIRYEITLRPGMDSADVSMHVRQSEPLLREVRFKNEAQLSNFRVDGSSVSFNDEVIWKPAESGGTLQWSAQIGHKRGNGGYDAFLADDWGIFRAEDLIPRAATKTLRGAFSVTTLQIHAPRGWSTVTAYPSENGSYFIDKPQRRFDQPDGWIAAGHLGVRRETIAGIRVAVAGPTGHSLRRMDILALLNWTLPELARVLPGLPQRLTIISAADPMWRGGLSGPNSLYLHADRPLISENATSTLLHEVVHSTLRLSAAEGYDWIVEGIAEFYSLELLRRSGTISESRFETALADQKSWSKSAEKLCRHASKAATTALAVITMAALNAEIRKKSGGTASLDDVVRALGERENAIDLNLLQDIAAKLEGDKSDVLDTDKLPGCRNIESDSQESP